MQQIDWGSGADFSGPQHYFRESLIVRTVLKNLEKGSAILDIGAGGGSLSFRLAKAGFRVYTVDSNMEAVRLLSGKVRKAGLDQNIFPRYSRGEKIPFRKGFFDAVTAGEVLEHIKNDRQVLAETSRVLKKEGLLVVTVPARPEIFGEIDRLAGHVRRYSGTELSEKAIQAGFNILEIFDWGFRMTNLWQKYVLLAGIKKFQLDPSGRKYLGILGQVWLHKWLSVFFWPDLLFRNTGKGYCLFMVAKKTKQ